MSSESASSCTVIGQPQQVEMLVIVVCSALAAARPPRHAAGPGRPRAAGSGRIGPDRDGSGPQALKPLPIGNILIGPQQAICFVLWNPRCLPRITCRGLSARIAFRTASGEAAWG